MPSAKARTASSASSGRTDPAASSSCSTRTRPRRRATDRACSACLYAAAAAIGPAGRGQADDESLVLGARPRSRRGRAVSSASAWSAQAATAAPPSAASTTSRSPSGTTSSASPAGRRRDLHGVSVEQRREAVAALVGVAAGDGADSAIISRKGASSSPPYRSPATARAWSGSPGEQHPQHGGAEPLLGAAAGSGSARW